MPEKTLHCINWEECYVLYLGMLEIKYIVMHCNPKIRKALIVTILVIHYPCSTHL